MVTPAWAWFGLGAAFLIALVVIIGMLAVRIIQLLETLNEKVTSLEKEVAPILRDVEQTLRNVEPLSRELGNRGDEIGKLLANFEKVSDDAQATTGAIRNGIVPIAHSLAGLFAGFQEGSKVISAYTKSKKDY
jgi:ABC-type transporter Mla subunit MlaD